MVSAIRIVFFFSSRRRHTRCSRDWSSDVCSSDLSVKARKLEKLTALTVELEGALDHFNAAELKQRLADAARRAKLDIIVNFEQLRHASPQALQTLLHRQFFKQAAASLRVRFRKVPAALDSALDGV